MRGVDLRGLPKGPLHRPRRRGHDAAGGSSSAPAATAPARRSGGRDDPPRRPGARARRAALLPAAASAQAGGCSRYGESRTTVQGARSTRDARRGRRAREQGRRRGHPDRDRPARRAERATARRSSRWRARTRRSTTRSRTCARASRGSSRTTSRTATRWRSSPCAAPATAAAATTCSGPRAGRHLAGDHATWARGAWSNGRVGLYGLSYDAATHVVGGGHRQQATSRRSCPASGLPDLYDLSFGGGTYDWRWWLFVPGYYHLYATIDEQPGRRATRPTAGSRASPKCPDLDAAYQATAESLATGVRDSRGYWAERNHKPGVERRYRGSILLIQGLQDWNVRPANIDPVGQRARAPRRRGQAAARPVGARRARLGARAHAAGTSPTSRCAGSTATSRARARRHRAGRSRSQDTAGRWRGEQRWPPRERDDASRSAATSRRRRRSRSTRAAATTSSARSRPLQTTDDWLPGARRRRGAVRDVRGRSAGTPATGCASPGMPEVRLPATPDGPTGHVDRRALPPRPRGRGSSGSAGA